MQITNSLFEQALKNARTKAETIANVSGRKLGKVVSVNEGGGGASIEVGSGTIFKSVTVVFELK